MSTISYPKVEKQPIQKRTAIIRSLLKGMVWVIGSLLILLSTIPVILLFIATAVPLYSSIVLAIVDISLLVALFWANRTPLLVSVIVLGIVLASVLAVWLSQVYATTPPIIDAQGNIVPGSIATLEEVQLGDSKQWVSIRGKDVHNPVLLFLAGGPGGSQLTTERHTLSKLEDYFVVVNWEQPGAGKSFNAVDRSTLTPERYIEDGHELVLHLRERFGVDKVYVVGESWGSALGIMLVQRYPDLFHAFIGTAQMVDFLETDLICYDFALNWAEERGDMKKLAQLREQGPPPYYGEDVAWKQVAYLIDTYAYMNQNPAIISGFNTPRDLSSPEYGLLDKVNWVRGPLDTLGIVYPHLWDIDFREQAPHLDVPVYFLIGRHDVNAPPELVEEYYELLDAPHKELIWFERSGHSPWIGESDKFVDVIVNRVLVQTQ
ncbi:MAG: alpha/beta hydrolase [Chloroflexi bacterium AL-W]|nr:alpha/beta hydrolase [Chloroflexi bacterium AL-N1]NOK68252.1 alpha/beta hydrolase [Chloroflexi bacterium AL-N10]NOK73898.1 alpha/beta hydrolase [Chloroflexi bacterium AL-N5]NOK82866.1 alpha/beta hydrolase [Chloroflexi bacterium AL-W]NOK90388.1 alpha/beta hydrolase [Chloroflexi bacterium AL-N15]